MRRRTEAGTDLKDIPSPCPLQALLLTSGTCQLSVNMRPQAGSRMGKWSRPNRAALPGKWRQEEAGGGGAWLSWNHAALEGKGKRCCPHMPGTQHEEAPVASAFSVWLICSQILLCHWPWHVQPLPPDAGLLQPSCISSHLHKCPWEKGGLGHCPLYE